MKYNFDEIVDRTNTQAYKYELCKPVFGCTDVLPLWVADMDFRTPQVIIDAIRERCDRDVLGYTVLTEQFYQDYRNWILEQHQWHTEQEWMGYLSGIVPGLAFAVNVFTEQGDEVIVQPPVYPPFINVTQANGRRVIYNQLKVKGDRFEMDFDAFERQITPNTKLMILCNPHNPGGRVWECDVLLRLSEICHKHGIIVVSDEIHADLVFSGHRHTPYASISKEAEQNSVTFMAPSKTFNMAGLMSSAYIIPNPLLRKRFRDFMLRFELCGTNVLSLAATHAAFTLGNDWRKEMLLYVEENVAYAMDFFATHLSKAKVMPPEASFLLWIDFSAYGHCSETLQKKMLHQGKIAMNQGTTFGPGGEQHLRLNIGTARATLKEALNRIRISLTDECK